MIGLFINITGLFSCLSAPFGAMGSVAGAVAQQRAARMAYEAQVRASRPTVVEKPTSIPKVEKRGA